jgi:tetratricopeptide (TPR) repeat protein
MKPLCFVLMPFGRKTDASGQLTDFDEVFKRVIAPAIALADMEPIRADEEQVGGTIHKPMFERLLLCEYAIADITGANPNVYYELGIRHAIRPRSTVIIFAQGTVLPFDVAPLRGLPYKIDAGGLPDAAEADTAAVTSRLRAARADWHDDSPLFQLVEDMPRVEVDHAKTDIFRDRVDKAKGLKDRLALARRSGKVAVRSIAAEPGFANLIDVDTTTIVDLFLSFRDVGGHQEMVDLYARMPKPLQRTRMVQEQLGFALNRLGQSEEAERTLLEVIKTFGASSETNGLLGRVYKNRWEAAKEAGRVLEARGFLGRAIETYLAGFQADWRDPYLGINALTLMEIAKQLDEQKNLLPVVRYAALQRTHKGGDYWDHATLLELAVLARNIDEATSAAAAALAVVRAPWEPETTLRNLRLIRQTRQERGEDVGWVAEIEHELEQAAAAFKGASEAAKG